MFNPLPVALNDLKRSRGGAAAIVLLVAMAVALGVAVSAQERALRQGSADAADAFDIIVGAPGSETQLVLTAVYLQPADLDLIDGAILADLADDEGVVFAAPLGFGDSWQGHPIVGTTDRFVRHLAGGALAHGTGFARPGDTVVGADVPLAVGAEIVPMHGQIVLDEEDEAHHGVALRVTGVLPPLGTPWDRALLVPIETVWAAHGLPTGRAPGEAEIERLLTGDGHAEPGEGVTLGPPWDRALLPGVPAIVIEPASVADAYELRQRYRSNDRTIAVFPAEVLIRLYGVLGDVRDLLAWISILTQVLVIAAVLLAIVASMAQKRRLVGVLRALGASRGYVFAVAWIGISLLIVCGAALGLALGWAAAAGLSAVLGAETAMRLPVALGWQEARLVLVIAVIGLVLAAVPSMLLYRQPVAAALKG
jgi:putative ABC transport system permease protein